MAAALAAVGEGRDDTLWWAIALIPVWHVLDKFDERARRRSAARLGLTWQTAPILSSPSGGLFYFAASLGPWTYRTLRGKPATAGRLPWSFYVAMRIVSAVKERHSWRAASACAPTPPGAVDRA